MPSLFISPLELVKVQDKVLLLTLGTSVIIEDLKIVDLIEKKLILNDTIDQDLLDKELEDRGINKTHAIAFLEKIGVLSKKTEQYSYWDSLFIISDLSKDEMLFYNLNKISGIENISLSTLEQFENIKVIENSLILVFLKKYNSNIITKIYEKLSKKSNVAFIQAYFFKDQFKVDGLYSPEMGTPCHFCHISRWLERERNSFGSRKYSWVNVIDLLQNNDISIPCCVPLDNTRVGYAIYIVQRRIQQIMGLPLKRIHVDSFISSLSADLISCEVFYDPIPHWSQCNCINE